MEKPGEQEKRELAVIFGAGNVGRGFIAELFFESGFEIVFVDVAVPVVEAINRTHSYPHYTVRSEGNRCKQIEHVSALYANEQERIVSALCAARIVATAVGANVLPAIAGPLALGLSERIRRGLPPVNILLCENLHGVSAFMRAALLEHMDGPEAAQLDACVGLLSTSIGRMIPAPVPALTAEHPAAILVEAYRFLPYDFAAAKGEMPKVVGLVGDRETDFNFYADRKLYVHNMGHCLSAYLAEFFGLDYIWQAIEQPEIRYWVRGAMVESALALASYYGRSAGELLEHVDDLLFRFGNRGLGDTVERVGRDARRKLAAGDRFLGALDFVLGHGGSCRFLLFAVACGLRRLARESGLRGEAELRAYLAEQDSALCRDEARMAEMLDYYRCVDEAFDFKALLAIYNRGFLESRIV